ncbi:MAG: DUF167 domain-containing protein [Candidatus Omnitrophica bacterium]|nr:DUF167 domain-containing protein [Candidatus Omnitrophota bacterium]
MIFSVRVNARSSRNYIEEKDGVLKVYLTKPACAGQANQQLVILLSQYFKVKKYQIKIKSGEKSRNKLIEVNNA